MKIKLGGFKTVVPTIKKHASGVENNTIVAGEMKDIFHKLALSSAQKKSFIEDFYENSEGFYEDEVNIKDIVNIDEYLNSALSFSLVQFSAADFQKNYIMLDGYNTMYSENFKDFDCKDLLFSVANFSSIPFGMDFTIYRREGDQFEWAGMADFYNDHDVTRLQDTVNVDLLVHYCGFLPYRIELTHDDDFWFEIEIKHCDFKDSNLVFADKFKPISEHVTECFHVREALIDSDEKLRSKALQEFKTL